MRKTEKAHFFENRAAPIEGDGELPLTRSVKRCLYADKRPKKHKRKSPEPRGLRALILP